MEKSEIKDYLILLNYIKSNNYAIRLKEKNKIQNEKICELEKEIEKIKNRIS